MCMHILKVTLMIFLFVFHGLNANGMSCKEATEDGKSTGVEGVKAKDTELSYVAPTGAGKADVNLKSGKLLVNHVKSVRLTGSEVIENILEPAFGDRINDEKISLEVGSDSVTIGALTLKNGVSFPEYIFSSSANNTELALQVFPKIKFKLIYL